MMNCLVLFVVRLGMWLLYLGWYFGFFRFSFFRFGDCEKNNISINKGKIVVVCRYFEVLLNIIFKLEENRNENIIFNFNVKIVLINGVESR